MLFKIQFKDEIKLLELEAEDMYTKGDYTCFKIGNEVEKYPTMNIHKVRHLYDYVNNESYNFTCTYFDIMVAYKNGEYVIYKGKAYEVKLPLGKYYVVGEIPDKSSCFIELPCESY